MRRRMPVEHPVRLRLRSATASQTSTARAWTSRRIRKPTQREDRVHQLVELLW